MRRVGDSALLLRFNSHPITCIKFVPKISKLSYSYFIRKAINFIALEGIGEVLIEACLLIGESLGWIVFS